MRRFCRRVGAFATVLPICVAANVYPYCFSAQESMGDLVYVEIAEEGQEVEQGGKLSMLMFTNYK